MAASYLCGQRGLLGAVVADLLRVVVAEHGGAGRPEDPLRAAVLGGPEEPVRDAWPP